MPSVKTVKPGFKKGHIILTTAHILNSHVATGQVPWQTVFKFGGFTLHHGLLIAGKYLSMAFHK
jgi:hypothetical protein